MLATQEALINDLESLLANQSVGDRAAILRRVTDLFVATSSLLSDEQIALFDDVMERLIQEVEISVRAAFGHILATAPSAPPKVVRMLALDDAFEVAAPILTYSERVNEATLVEGAKAKSQAHLLAISRRKTLMEPVTDVLVERGNQEVALSTAQNPGAAFSEFGYSRLVQRSSDDDDLAECVWSRPEIQRQHLLKLFANASETVKSKLIRKDPSKAGTILEIVAQASQQLQARVRQASPNFAAAYAYVQSLYASGALDEARLAEFARAAKFDETTIALSLICDLPIAMIERLFVEERPEQLIVIGKASGLSWNTIKTMMAHTNGRPMPKIEQHFETFARLKADTAKKAIQFYRLRERAAISRLN